MKWVPGRERDRSELPLIVGTAVAVALGLQLERLFVSTMIFVVDQSQRTELARNALLTFSAIGLAAILLRIFAVDRTIWISLAILAGTRSVVQFVGDPELRWPLAAIGFIAWGWLIVALSLRNRSVLAPGLAAGLILDLSLRAGFDSIDLTQMRTPAKDGMSLVLITVMLVTLALGLRVSRPVSSWSLPDPSLLGIGAGIGIYALLTGNLGLPLVAASADLRTSFLVLVVGPLAALATSIFWRETNQRVYAWPLSEVWRILLAFAGFVALLSVTRSDLSGTPYLLTMVVASFCTTSLMIESIEGTGKRAIDPHLVLATIWVTLGLLLHGASVFLYFASSGSPNWVVPVYFVLALSGLLPRHKHVEQLATATSRVLLSGSAALALVALFATASGHVRAPQPALAESFTVVTYNIQNGFSKENRWDLEATAQTIESFDPDIVLLQETGRGWFAIGWADQVGWLSRRLNMEMVFGPASEDDLWGNTILSVAPLSDKEVLKYSANQNLNRGIVSATVTTVGDDLWVASTHLDNPKNADDVRVAQVERMIAHWDGQTPAVIGGDFNMTPDEDAIGMILDAGFIDGAKAAGQESPTSESGRRIDYVFVSNGLVVQSALVPDVWTSDHRPVGISLELR